MRKLIRPVMMALAFALVGATAAWGVVRCVSLEVGGCVYYKQCCVLGPAPDYAEAGCITLERPCTY